ncbi:MAG: hypothetical protein IPL05_16125 [Betaproteobacteria bacterium]|nr:hypothetical protein [Betaproteobacteria bacterium]
MAEEADYRKKEKQDFGELHRQDRKDVNQGEFDTSAGSGADPEDRDAIPEGHVASARSARQPGYAPPCLEHCREIADLAKSNGATSGDNPAPALRSASLLKHVRGHMAALPWSEMNSFIHRLDAL